MNLYSGRAVTLTPNDPAKREFGRDVFLGMAHHPKTIPCKYLYDARGSQLFEQICQLEEYYLTRTEGRLLQRHAGEVARFCGPHCTLIELGSGSSAKTRFVLRQLERPGCYIPIDIARDELEAATRDLLCDYPELDVQPICADYRHRFGLPDAAWASPRRLIFFPGSTVGNLEPAEAEGFLAHLGEWTVPDDGLLIGVDLIKPRDLLERAYNDVQGLTAAFNLNLLQRINRELGANFDLERFQHRAPYNERDGRIEMHLVSSVPQSVQVLGREFSVDSGEVLVTEHSYKYSLEAFVQMAGRAGLTVNRIWTDARQWFGVILFQW